FFNRRIFPSEDVYPGGEDLSKVGTRTIFPLGPETCVIVSHLQLTRNPHTNPLEPRVNARAFQQTVANLTDLQFGRELAEDEVIPSRSETACRNQRREPQSLARTLPS